MSIIHTHNMSSQPSFDHPQISHEDLVSSYVTKTEMYHRLKYLDQQMQAQMQQQENYFEERQTRMAQQLQNLQMENAYLKESIVQLQAEMSEYLPMDRRKISKT